VEIVKAKVIAAEWITTGMRITYTFGNNLIKSTFISNTGTNSLQILDRLSINDPKDLVGEVCEVETKPGPMGFTESRFIGVVS
jgi:hypothetical protein